MTAPDPDPVRPFMKYSVCEQCGLRHPIAFHLTTHEKNRDRAKRFGKIKDVTEDIIEIRDNDNPRLSST